MQCQPLSQDHDRSLNAVHNSPTRTCQESQVSSIYNERQRVLTVHLVQTTASRLQQQATTCASQLHQANHQHTTQVCVDITLQASPDLHHQMLHSSTATATHGTAEIAAAAAAGAAVTDSCVTAAAVIGVSGIKSLEPAKSSVAQQAKAPL